MTGTPSKSRSSEDMDDTSEEITVPSLGSMLGTVSLEEYNTHLLFGDIHERTAEETCKFLLGHHFEGKEADSNLIINSAGGVCSDGFSIIDMMKLVSQDVVTIGTGMIMSMGFMIFINGTKGKRFLTENCMVMCHQHNTTAPMLKYYEFISQAEVEKRVYKAFVANLVANSNLTKADVETLLMSHKDNYLTPKECVKYGLADGIIKTMF